MPKKVLNNESVKHSENENAFKHQFGPKLLKRLTDSLEKAYPSFPRKHFLGIMPALEVLEMKDRVRFIRDELKKHLPSEYEEALAVLVKSSKDGTLDGFDLWPYTEFVQNYGLGSVEISLEALTVFTTLFTSEWAVRPFIKQHEKTTMKFLEACVKHPDKHIRRWTCEGTRPRLPWGERLQHFVADPKPTRKILEALKFDSELYVRKSVANHLNDITKDHPDYVVDILKNWQAEASIHKDPENISRIDWIVKRALRTLIKAGHPGALKTIGVGKAKAELHALKLRKSKIRIGDRLEFEFELRSLSSKPQKIVLDYIIHFVKANGNTAPKVFKLRTFELKTDEITKFLKTHHLKKITTREYYPGAHRLEIQMNGIVVAKTDWTLIV